MARRRPAEKIPLELILADRTVHPETGHALFVERAIDSSTGTLTVEAEFPNPDGVLRPGQYGRVRAVIDKIEAARLVPQRAVQELQGKHQVWVVGADETVALRNVTMGRRVDQLWVVDEGLEAGERIVVDGIQRLRAGVKVSAKTWEPPPPPAGAVVGA
jgi:membrane fusion protein (multidrug efflux system)